MIGFGTSPGKTHSADVCVGGGDARQALSCFVGVASTSEEIAVLEVKA